MNFSAGHLTGFFVLECDLIEQASELSQLTVLLQ